jgi:predicted metal-dependent hydrolase
MPRVLRRETVEIDGLAVTVTRKRMQRMRLAVHPPDGRVTLSVPLGARREEWTAFLLSQSGWIRDRTTRMARPAPALYACGEIHYLWGLPCVLHVEEHRGKASAVFGEGSILLRVPPRSDAELRESVMHAGYAAQLLEAVGAPAGQAQAALGVRAARFFARRMKSRWGSCSPRSGSIRLNTELAKHPPRLLEYVLVHELAHLLEPGHNSRFYSLVERALPDWRTARAELHALSPG